MEKYVEKCLLSCVKQDISTDEYEIIAVNDGSTDNSDKILKELCGKYDNIRLVHKKNGGLSSARNYGLLHAKGDFIWFVDSDDYIEPNILLDLLGEIVDKRLDLLGFNVYNIWGEMEESYFQIDRQPLDKVISGEEYIRDYPINISACFFIVKRSILMGNNIRFIEGIVCEDHEYTLHLYKYIQRMKFTNRRAYNYFHRENSISTTKTNAHTLTIIHSWQTIIEAETARFNNISPYSGYANYYVNHHKYMALAILLKSEIPYSIKKMEFEKLIEIKAFKIGNMHIGYKMGNTHISFNTKFKSFLLRLPMVYYLIMFFIEIHIKLRKWKR